MWRYDGNRLRVFFGCSYEGYSMIDPKTILPLKKIIKFCKNHPTIAKL